MKCLEMWFKWLSGVRGEKSFDFFCLGDEIVGTFKFLDGLFQKYDRLKVSHFDQVKTLFKQRLHKVFIKLNKFLQCAELEHARCFILCNRLLWRCSICNSICVCLKSKQCLYVALGLSLKFKQFYNKVWHSVDVAIVSKAVSRRCRTNFKLWTSFE